MEDGSIKTVNAEPDTIADAAPKKAARGKKADGQGELIR
jgi:hypothetical protein